MAIDSVSYGSLPFAEQISFFRQKVNMPTKSWTDLWEGMHSRAFVVAGAIRDDLLTDLRGAVDKAISEGTTIAQFRKDFDALIEKHGWTYKGGRNWRTRVIYDTNLRQSYNAGREKQMADPELRRLRPYGRYRHGHAIVPREEHLAWHNLVLPLDHPWWQTHTPSNGWGCHCGKDMLSMSDVQRLGLTVADEAPALNYREVTVGQKGPHPRTVKVPHGIDPGFAYNPGTAAWGRQISDKAMADWRATGKDAWEKLTPGDWQSHGRQKDVPVDTPKAAAGPVIGEKKQAVQALERVLGGKERIITAPTGQRVLINGESLVEHIKGDLPSRTPFLPMLPEVISDPFEIWLSFEQHRGTGLVALRQRFIKVIHTDKNRAMIVVVQANKGMLETWTVFPRSKLGSLKNERVGKLLWGRKE